MKCNGKSSIHNMILGTTTLDSYKIKVYQSELGFSSVIAHIRTAKTKVAG